MYETKYPIEHYKELLRTNPEWLGDQAREVLVHYIELEYHERALADDNGSLLEINAELQTRMNKLDDMLFDAYRAMYSEFMGCPSCIGHIGYGDEYHQPQCPWSWIAAQRIAAQEEQKST